MLPIASSTLLVCLLCAPSAARATAQAPSESKSTAPAAAQPAESALANASLEAYRLRLLDTAFEAACRVPVKPHAKTRGALQWSVASANIALEQPLRALECAGRIESWRRGVCLADLADYCAKSGRRTAALDYLAQAREVAGRTDVGITQDWQKDQILAHVAAALARLGELESAQKLSNGLVESERGSVSLVRAQTASEAELESRLAEAEDVIRTQRFEATKQALATCAALYERVYAQADLRERAKSAIVAGFDMAKLPFELRVDVLCTLFDSAVKHADLANAHKLVEELHALCATVALEPLQSIPLRSRLAALRQRAGDTPGAQLELEEQYATYFREREHLHDYDRANALLPIAETFAALGLRPKALAVYRQAIDDGAQNPNARARVEDYVATLLSMAKQSVEPDEALWAQIARVGAGLADPW